MHVQGEEMSAPELLPCPFCGVPDEPRMSSDDWMGDRKTPWAMVICELCGVDGPWESAETRIEAEAKAAAAWNRRPIAAFESGAHAPAPAADVEAERAASPDPWKGDIFWMLENDKGEWLMDRESYAVTRDPMKAMRFPNEVSAYDVRRAVRDAHTYVIFKPTQHSWLARASTASAPSPGGVADGEGRK